MKQDTDIICFSLVLESEALMWTIADYLQIIIQKQTTLIKSQKYVLQLEG